MSDVYGVTKTDVMMNKYLISLYMYNSSQLQHTSTFHPNLIAVITCLNLSMGSLYL